VTEHVILAAGSNPLHRPDRTRHNQCMADQLSSRQRSELMARVKTRNTAPEIALRRALWAAGVRGWRLHPKAPGRPDLAWRAKRVAVFVDGAFWHGHPDHYHGQSGEFWDKKIARNRKRDEIVNAELAELGWTVVRLWDFEIERELPACVARVEEAFSMASEGSVRSSF
jgi:DNA mismatch endonuclease (patch repair protein)